MADKRLETQTFNDGLCQIFNVEDAAQPGGLPKPSLSKKYAVRFSEMTVGMYRYTDFLQFDVQVERLLRLPRLRDVSTQDVVGIAGDAVIYKIVQLQYPRDVTPPCMDLSLERTEQVYGKY